MTDLPALATSCGATVLGDPPHFMFDAEQLREFVRLVKDTTSLGTPAHLVTTFPAPPY